jgi:20S proteasome alpha/beta subunit
MTIAIGYHCFKGVIVAADTAIVLPPADLQEETKLTTFVSASGSFAIVNASNDGNATATLLADVTDKVRSDNPSTYSDLQRIFKREMTEWRRAFGRRRPPDTQLILAAKLLNNPPKLFFCEPPNTVVEKDDYIAAGYGAAVTDPVYSTLFKQDGGEYSDVQQVLRRVSYMMYRAKKDNVYCGKKTDCAVVWKHDAYPEDVQQSDMERAEKRSEELDWLFSAVTMFAFGGSTTEMDSVELGKLIGESTTMFRGTTFRGRGGEELSL